MDRQIGELSKLARWVASLDLIEARILVEAPSAIMRSVRRSRVHVAPECWLKLKNWVRLGRFDPKLRIRKLRVVLVWKAEVNRIIQAAIQALHAQLALVKKLNVEKCSRASVKGDNYLVRRLPAHLRGAVQYRCYEGKREFWGFALRRDPERVGLASEGRAEFHDRPTRDAISAREALSVHVRLKNGLLPALAIHLFYA